MICRRHHHRSNSLAAVSTTERCWMLAHFSVSSRSSARITLYWFPPKWFNQNIIADEKPGHFIINFAFWPYAWNYDILLFLLVAKFFYFGADIF